MTYSRPSELPSKREPSTNTGHPLAHVRLGKPKQDQVVPDPGPCLHACERARERGDARMGLQVARPHRDLGEDAVEPRGNYEPRGV